MEVHSHAHTPHGREKKWTHYFWEFFMLFLAVTLGFFVENQREHYVEHQREKQYIKSLLADLQVDNKTLERQIANIRIQLSMMDSMITILNDPQSIAKNGGQLYYLGRVSPRTQTLSVNNRTFEQLKNSGNFRLIRNLDISDKIMAYYDKLQLIRQVEGLFNDEFTEYKKIAAKVFDPAIFKSMEQDNGVIARTASNPSLRTADQGLLKELSVFAVYMNGSRRGLLNFEQDFQQTALDLIKYLKNAYHLE
jgi:hypothetical protein